MRRYRITALLLASVMLIHMFSLPILAIQNSSNDAGALETGTRQTGEGDEDLRFPLDQVGLTVEDGVIKIQSGADLVKLSHVNINEYCDKTVRLIARDESSVFDTTESVTIQVGGTEHACRFIGLDSFTGTVSVFAGSENYPIKLTRPLFNTLSDHATITTDSSSGLLLMFMAETSEGQQNALPDALLAATVTHAETPATTAWEIRVAASDGNGILPPLIGVMEAGAQVKLSMNLSSAGQPAVKLVKGNGHAGLVCADMKANASLTLSGLQPESPVLPAVTAVSGDAGSLVGQMASGTALILGADMAFTISDVTASGSAGGLVGSATDVRLPRIPTIDTNATISGKNAGGLIGSYTYTGTVENSLSRVTSSVSGITVSDGSASDGNAGGVFGVLRNANDFSFADSTNSATVNATLSSNNAGGLIGQYSAASLAATLRLNPGDVTSALSSSAGIYGGLVGYVSNNAPAYIEAKPTGKVTICGTANHCGGLIGSLSDNGHYLQAGNVTIENSGDIKGKTTAGGVAGLFESGVLQLSGAVTAVTPACDNASYRGNYVGKRENTLVFSTYRPEAGWAFNQNDCNDIGNWGQVLQVYEGSGLNGLLTVGANHTVTVTGTGTNVTVSDKLSFAQAALRFQLDNKGALQLQEDISNLNDVTISLSGNIDLNGTGLTGFQRDYGNAVQAGVTLNATGATITFPDIPIYGSTDNNDIFAHNRQGLFARTNSLTVNTADNDTLTLNGQISVTARNKKVWIGALTAESAGDVTATNVSCEAALKIIDGKGDDQISGLVAYQGGGTVTFTGCRWSFAISCTGSGSSYLGGFLARAENGNTVSIRNGTIGGSITHKSSGERYVGGLIASLRDHSNGSWKNTLTIDGLTADGVTINTPNSSKTGGILGWEWMTETTEIRGVTVKNCELLSGSSAQFGGLVFKGSGYWKVYETGIRLESVNTFRGASSTTAPSGMLLAVGSKQKDHGNALYLEIQQGAYTISDSVTLDIGGSTVFDEIVGATESENGNGIVSIGTGIDVDHAAENDCNYTKQLSTDYINPNTRYYYNLDVFRNGNAASGEINTAGKLVLYSAYTHGFKNLRKYFYSNPGNITGALDLTGYSYYPAESYANIQGADITFDYQGLFENDYQGLFKKNRQNYGMHTGLFTDVILADDSIGSKTLTVENLTLSGTVGGIDGTYGALIRGNAQGGNTNAKLNLEIHGVILNNVHIYPFITDTNTVAPMLIHSIGSYTKMNMSGVETKNYTDGYAASSLIGAVGSETGGHIQLTFSDMALSNNRFSRAWFLEDFQYAGDSSGVYNFKKADRYTLGQELSNTDRAGEEVGPSGRNNGQQYCFFEDTTYVCTKVGGESADPAIYFNGYRRYVYHGENGAHHELDINLARTGLTEGCGTYNDPYIIRTAKQLEELASALSGVVAGMKIQVDSGVLSGSTLNSFSDSHTSNATGTHRVYTGSETNWQQESTSITAANMQLYLRNAYYKIFADDIVLPSNWTGLGADSNTAFCGVIDGGGNTIIVNASTGFSQFGGLIKFSMGSVVKNLTVQYDTAPGVTCQGVPNSTSNASFFGGVVGWCLGGDTVLENVAVTGLSTPSVTGTNPHLAAVGGYVGMVGGAMMDGSLSYGGGVVFRRRVGGGLSTGNALENTKYFYVNPYVGRVLDGYALSESQSLDNTDKNYQIPKISSGTYLTRHEASVQVSGSEGLWLLSAIANSGAGAMQDRSCLAYTTGKARTGDYGDTMNDKGIADERYIGGKANTGKTKSYLSRYVSGDIYHVCSAGISLSLTGDCDMTSYGNGFRGIGTSYGTNANNTCSYRLLKVTSVVGNQHTITLAQNRKEYVEEKDAWTSIGAGMFVLMGVPSNGSLTVSNLTFTGKTGIQYFKGTADAAIGDLNYGKKKTSANTGDRLTLVGVGMLTGSFAKIGTVSGITLNNVSVSGTQENQAKINNNSLGTTFAGGLIGAIWNNGTVSKADVINCSAQYVDVNGRLDTGGLIGYLKATTASIDGQTTLSNVSVATSQVTASSDLTGAAGLLGYCDGCTLKIGDDNNTLCVRNIRLTSPQKESSNDYFSFSALVGAWITVNQRDGGFVKNLSMQGNIDICGGAKGFSNSASAGVVGCFYDSAGNWGSGTAMSHLELANIRIATEAGSGMAIYNTKQAGGIVGMIKAQRNTAKWPETVTLTDIQIGSKSSSVTITANAKIWSNAPPQVGGIVGVIAIDPIVVMKNIRLINTNVLSCDKSTVESSGKECSAGLIIGCSDGHTSNATDIRMSEIYAENCHAVVDREKGHAGLLAGRLKSKNHLVTGSNILFKGCSVGVSLMASEDSIKPLYSTDVVPTLERIGLKGSSGYKSYNDIGSDIQSYAGNQSIGGLVGNLNVSGTEKTIKLVGISIQESNLPSRDVGSGTPQSNSYIIRADYQGTCMGEAPNTSGAGSPYVTINPVSPLKIPDKTITGDGAVFAEGTTTPLLREILSGNRYYNTMNASKAYLTNKCNDGTLALTSLADEELNTITETKFSIGDDFPVVVLQTNSSDVANRCLSSVISMLTNWELCTDSDGTVTTGTKGFQSLTATSYHWVESEAGNADGSFVAQTAQSLFVQDNRFYLKQGGYDNKLMQFTLVDVAYKDPSNLAGEDIVYHLYIPVVVKKVFGFKFWASAMLGTTYSADPYAELSKPVLASYGESVTVLLNYEYQWTKEEWQDALARDLLWNFELGVSFNPDGLPAHTRLTLIDRNDRDRAYYATTNGGSAVSFKSFTDETGNFWSKDLYLCDYLKLTATENNTNGRFYRLGKTKAEGATIRDMEGYYYKPASGETENVYDLTISALNDSSDKITVQFYLTLFTPVNYSEIVNTVVQCADSLPGVLPNKRYKVDANKDYAKNDSENRLVLGNFFTQETSVTTSRSDEKMTDIHASIPLVLETKITFTSDKAKETYKGYGSGQRLYQKFELKLREYPGLSQKEFVRGTQIQVQYKLGDTNGAAFDEVLTAPVSSYPLEFRMTDEEPGISADKLQELTVTNEIVLRAEVTLTYPSEARMEQFPARETEGSLEGIAVVGSSTLAYNLDFLRHSASHGVEVEATLEGNTRHFYREESGAATLHYFAYENLNGAPAESVSELGINGRDGSAFEIHTEALYNVSNVKGAETADKLKVTISLLEKQEPETQGQLNYTEVDSLDKYLSSRTINAYYKQRGGSDMQEASVSSNTPTSGTTLTFDLSNLDSDVQLRIPITLLVRTGEGFEGRYANYRILVTAELIWGNSGGNSLATDYIVYTNAKICKSFIEDLADVG